MDVPSLDKLRKIAGMLGSEHAGERAAAALKATAMLKAAGVSWGQIDLARGTSYATLDQGHMANYWQSMYQGERAQSERRAAEIQKLKREVDRLKSMWPQGEPPKRRPNKPKVVREAEQDSLLDYDKMLREKIAAAVEAAASGELMLGRGTLAFFRRVMLDPEWTDADRGAVEKTLRWVYAKAGG